MGYKKSKGLSLEHIKKVDERIEKDYPDRKPVPLADMVHKITNSTTPLPPKKKNKPLREGKT